VTVLLIYNQGASYQKYVLWQRNCTTFVTDMLTRALPEGDTRLGTLKLVLAPHDAATILDQDVQGHGGDLVKEKL